jgi:hypothetical protein
MASHSVFEIVVLVATVALYFLPALIADRRKRHDLLIIALFNAVLGWTGIGWVLALFWSLQPNPAKDLGTQTKDRQRRLGMGVFSRLLSERVAARAARADDRERPSR